MSSLWTIYKYELKKLTHRKLFRITAFLCVISIVITSFAGLMGELLCRWRTNRK